MLRTHVSKAKIVITRVKTITKFLSSEIVIKF